LATSLKRVVKQLGQLGGILSSKMVFFAKKRGCGRSIFVNSKFMYKIEKKEMGKKGGARYFVWFSRFLEQTGRNAKGRKDQSSQGEKGPKACWGGGQRVNGKKRTLLMKSTHRGKMSVRREGKMRKKGVNVRVRGFVNLEPGSDAINGSRSEKGRFSEPVNGRTGSDAQYLSNNQQHDSNRYW